MATVTADGASRRVAGLLLGVSAFAALFATSFIGALHQPKPHDVPIAVVAPAPAVTVLQQRLGARLPGAFTLERYGSVARATTALRDASVDAVWVPPPLPVSDGRSDGGKPVARLFTASAVGAVPSEIITRAFSTVGGAAGDAVSVKDLVPLPARDPFGASSFFFGVAVFLPSFLGGMVMALLLRGTPALVSIGAILLLAVCVGLVDTTVADPGLGALVGGYGALIGIAALTSIAVSAPIVAAGRLWSPVGPLLGVLVFVVLGLPATGGPFGSAFLPGFQRAFAPGLPLTNAVVAVRNASYFEGHDLAGHLGVLAAWAGAGLLVLTAFAVLERKGARRQPAPDSPIKEEAPVPSLA